MLTFYIPAAIIVPGILFLIYCFVSFNRAERHKGKRHATQSAGERIHNLGREGIYKVVLTTLALTIPATVAAQTTQAVSTIAAAEYKVANGFLVPGEWRSDCSNVPFSLRDSSDVLKHDQI